MHLIFSVKPLSSGTTRESISADMDIDAIMTMILTSLSLYKTTTRAELNYRAVAMVILVVMNILMKVLIAFEMQILMEILVLMLVRESYLLFLLIGMQIKDHSILDLVLLPQLN